MAEFYQRLSAALKIQPWIQFWCCRRSLYQTSVLTQVRVINMIMKLCELRQNKTSGFFLLKVYLQNCAQGCENQSFIWNVMENEFKTFFLQFEHCSTYNSYIISYWMCISDLQFGSFGHFRPGWGWMLSISQKLQVLKWVKFKKMDQESCPQDKSWLAKP